VIVGAKELEAKLGKLGAEFDAHKAGHLRRVADQLAPPVDDAVRADIGDLSMSGWTARSGDAIEIHGTVPKSGPVRVEPSAKGPMRVLTDGRQAYSAGDRRTSGAYVSKKTGERRQKSRKVKRNVGATQGKGTWGDAVGLMEPRFVELMGHELHDVMDSTFNKG